MLRNHKPISVDLAADIEVNTNFILPQRGNSIVRRVNNYRQTQRETNKQSLHSHQLVTLPSTKVGNKQIIGLQIPTSMCQSSNCKAFMLPDSPRATSYEFSLAYQEPKQQKRPFSTDYQDKTVIRQSSQAASYHNKDQEYLGAVKQATKMLRKTMVLNFVDQIQNTLQIQPPKSQVQPPQTVTQERINQALRKSVSRTERRLKSTARDPHKVLNSVSPTSLEAAGRDCVTNRMSNTVLQNGTITNNQNLPFQTRSGSTVKLGLALANFTQRPKSMKAGHIRQNNMKQLQDQETLSIEKPLLNVLSETRASTHGIKSQEFNQKRAISKSNVQMVSSSENTIAANHLKTEPPNVTTLSADALQISQGEIAMIGQYEMFVPQVRQTKDDFAMSKFVGFIKKGYLKQAAMCLNNINPHYHGFRFNQGLLYLLENQPENCVQLLEGFPRAVHNYQKAKGVISQKQVTKEKDPDAIVNNNYFKRTYPYGSKNELTLPTKKEVKIPAVINDWDLFLMCVKQYKKDDFARFVEDKTYFDKVIKRMNHICDDESQLIPNCITRIINGQGVDQGDTEKIITITQLRDTVLRDAPNLAADKSLKEVFVEMIMMQSTYCVGTKDPIQESFDFLVEGLRAFDEKFQIEVFVNEFLLESQKSNVEDIKRLLERYKVQDRLITRALTFIMSCFDSEQSQEEKNDSLNFLLRIVREAKEVKLKRTMDPARFQIEQLFNHLVDDIVTASRNENGHGLLGPEDQYLSDRLNFHKELSGRHEDALLMKVGEFTKPDLERHQAIERDIEKLVNFSKLDPNSVTKEKKIEIYKKLEASWQRHIKQPLSREDLKIVQDKVQLEISEIEERAKENLQIYKFNIEQDQLRAAEIASGLIPARLKYQKQSTCRSLNDSMRKKFQSQMIENMQQKELDESNYNICEEEENEASTQKQKKKHFEVCEENINVSSQQVQFGTSMANLWEDHPSAASLRNALYQIQLMCDDDNIITAKDKVRLGPLMEKWGVEAVAAKETYENNNGPVNDQTSSSKERPKIGKPISVALLSYLKTTLTNIKDLFQSQLNKLDDVLVENFRFFSIIDKNVRIVIYKSVELVHYANKGTLIENDVDETDYVYVVLKGSVDYMLFKFETNVTVIAASYRPGEVFGDASIQRQYFDVFKCLSKDRKYLETSVDDVYALRIPKQDFVSAIFAEMRVELMYKILMFRNTSYFKELSPYSLIMFASICDVMDYKYGEILVTQGDKPQACYLVASGQCQALYHYVEQQSTVVSKYARKVLHTGVSKPFVKSMIDYKNLALLQARDFKNPIPVKKQVKTKKVKPINIEQQSAAAQDDPPAIKRAFYHGVLSTDPVQKTIQFENHLLFGDIKQGQVFGARTLLDQPTFNKHVAQNSIRFSEQLGIVADDWIDSLREKRKQELSKKRSQYEAQQLQLKQKGKFCKECFEQRQTTCECGQKDQSNQQVKKLFFDQREGDDLSASLASNGSPTIDNKLHEQSSQGDMTLTRRLTKRERSTVSNRALKQQSKDQEDFSDETYQRMFIDHMHDNLMRSQTSIMVISAVAKLIVIKKEDKTFLNEALKQSIDRVIIEENFKDHDRPLPNFKEVQNAVETERGWIAKKKHMEEDVLREAKFNRAANKLLE